jgi:hypothetical protein
MTKFIILVIVGFTMTEWNYFLFFLIVFLAPQFHFDLGWPHIDLS